MRNSKLVVVLAASAALVAAPLITATSASSAAGGSNAGTGATISGPARQPGTTTASAAFKVYAQPVAKYTGKSCAMDLSAIPDFTVVSTLTGCDTIITLIGPAEKRSVPGSWATWGAPPDTESATPHILYTAGATSIIIDDKMAANVGGVEIEPNPFAVHSFTVDFYAKSGCGGKLRGSITRSDVDGSAGAKLFAAKSKKPFKSMCITSNDGVDFSIAQIRS